MSSRIRNQSYVSRTERELREDNASLLDTVNESSETIYRRGIIIGILVVILVVLSVLFTLITVSKNAELDNAHYTLSQREAVIRCQEHDIQGLSEKIDELLDSPPRVSLGQAFANCLDVASASMAEVAVDAFGNPLNVTDFADSTCRSELKAAGESGFIEKFSQQG